MIAAAVGPAWSGEYAYVDLRQASLPQHAAALLISGSSANVHTRQPWMLRSEAALRRLVGAGTAVFGICFGHQLLAQALGGEVRSSDMGREISTVEVTPSATDPLLGEGASFAANACHFDTVARLPSGTAVLAHNPHEPHQMLRFAQHCYGVQFHPEFDAEVMRAYVLARADAMRAEGLDPQAALAAARDTPQAREVLRRFVAKHARRGGVG